MESGNFLAFPGMFLAYRAKMNMTFVSSQTKDHVSEEQRLLLCTINMARGLEKLADKVDFSGRDELCVLAGIMRDCAYKVRNRAAVEVQRLKRQELAERGTKDK